MGQCCKDSDQTRRCEPCFLDTSWVLDMLGEIVTPDEYISIIGGGNDATEGGDCVEVYGERAKSGSSGHVWNSNHALGDPDEQYYKNEMQNADGSWKHRTERGDSIP